MGVEVLGMTLHLIPISNFTLYYAYVMFLITRRTALNIHRKQTV